MEDLEAEAETGEADPMKGTLTDAIEEVGVGQEIDIQMYLKDPTENLIRGIHLVPVDGCGHLTELQE